MELERLEAGQSSKSVPKSSLQTTSGYAAGPPWIFTGRALYQVHLVKAQVAKQFIPPELKLVQAFGYTLGGLYLAHYNCSPAGTFDELVVIAGTVWNTPTSCAWAARVLVNNLVACKHGREVVGLPSHFADFRMIERMPQKQRRPWWNPFSRFRLGCSKLSGNESELNISEINGSLSKPLCCLNLPRTWISAENQITGPSLSMSLPSFSVKLVKPAAVTTTSSLINHKDHKAENDDMNSHDMNLKAILSLLTAKPLIALYFERMTMHVKAPSIVEMME